MSFGIAEKIADQHGLRIARQAVRRRELGRGVARPALLGEQHLAEALDDVARGERARQPEQADAFAAADQQISRGEAEHKRAVDLRLQRELGGKIHRGGAVDPQHNRMRGLPLPLAHVKPLVARGAAPVDAACRFAGDEGAKLPEGFAKSGAAASVHAMQHARRDLARGDDEARETPRQRQRLILPWPLKAAFGAIE